MFVVVECAIGERRRVMKSEYIDFVLISEYYFFDDVGLTKEDKVNIIASPSVM